MAKCTSLLLKGEPKIMSQFENVTIVKKKQMFILMAR